MADESAGSRSMHAVAVGLLFSLIGLVGVAYGLGHWRAPELASRHGAGIDSMMVYLLLCVGTMFLAGHLILGYMIVKNGVLDRVTLRRARPRTEKRLSIALGVVMALVAEGGVVAIGVPVWDEYYSEPIPDDAITVEVTAQQFVWNFRYPGPDLTFGRTDPTLYDDVTNPVGLDRTDPAAADDIVSVNQLYIPVDETTHLILKSRDVIHSLFLPHFRVKQDAVPGMSIDVKFVPTRTGDFEIACTELCGMAHYRMQGFLHVTSRADFDGWLRSNQ